MRTWPFLAAYLFLLACCFAAIALACLLLFRHTTHRTASPLRAFAPCVEKVAGPTPVFACRNGRSYALQSGDWVDMGKATPLPGVNQG